MAASEVWFWVRKVPGGRILELPMVSVMSTHGPACPEGSMTCRQTLIVSVGDGGEKRSSNPGAQFAPPRLSGRVVEKTGYQVETRQVSLVAGR